MKPEYEKWTRDWLTEKDALEHQGYGMCKEAAEAMAEAFPSLKVVPGHVHCLWGKRGHWWCVDEDGSIVDPTAGQFQCIFEYEGYKEGDEVRLGRCMNCGEEIWGPSPETVYSTMFCNQFCESETVHSFGL